VLVGGGVWLCRLCMSLGERYGVCVFWPPVKCELLLSMRYQSLVLTFTFMRSPLYHKPQ